MHGCMHAWMYAWMGVWMHAATEAGPQVVPHAHLLNMEPPHAHPLNMTRGGSRGDPLGLRDMRGHMCTCQRLDGRVDLLTGLDAQCMAGSWVQGYRVWRAAGCSTGTALWRARHGARRYTLYGMAGSTWGSTLRYTLYTVWRPQHGARRYSVWWTPFSIS